MHIVDSSQLSMSEATYVALSHCWGRWGDQKLGKAKYQFCGDNRTFLFEDLPRTFQHAAIVTKMIGKRYLWIDSLCINQDDKKDWGRESEIMYEVFKNSYCTIAATSAMNSDEGFLNGPVTVPDPESWETNFGPDFRDAVENGVLNKRAWVLQERTLSRRILHFTQKQLFLECGRGVCWGPFGYLTNGKISFRSDPNFPASLKDRSVATQIALFQSLFGDYSTYGLTEPTDRPTAIKSLAIAMAKVFDPPTTKGNEVEGGRVYNGIFGTRPYLHRSLLWRRIRDPLEHEFSEPLDFSQAQLPHLPPPTWSWMAYKGRIDYLDVENEPEWDTSAGFLGDLVGLKDPVRLKVRGAKCRTAIRFQRKNDNEWNAYEEAQEVAHLWFDQSMPEMCEELRCALIGRDVNTQMGDRKYYVLFIDAGNSLLIRLGVGWIYESAINFGEVTELYIA